MDKELYFGVDVSKKTLDLAYYDGETIDWKNAHIKVSNDEAGFKKIAKEPQLPCLLCKFYKKTGFSCTFQKIIVYLRHILKY